MHERRWTGAIESHPAPLHVIWGDLDPVAVWPMAERIVHGAAPTRPSSASTGVGHYPMVESAGAVQRGARRRARLTSLRQLRAATHAVERGTALEAGDQRVARRVAVVHDDVPEPLRVEHEARAAVEARRTSVAGSGRPSGPVSISSM